MKTEPIVFVSATAEEEAIIRGFLEHQWRRTLPSVRTITKFGEPTVASTVFRLETSDGEYIFKLPNWRGSDERALREQVLLLQVADAYRRAGLPVAETVLTDAGEWCARAGERVALVQRMVTGKHFGGTDAEIESAGAAVGHLHAISLQFPSLEPTLFTRVHDEIKIEKPYPECVARWSSGMRADLLREGSCARAATCTLLREKVGELDRLIQRVADSWSRLKTPLPAGLIHNDWNPNNGLYGSDGRLVAVLDFELLCEERFVVDIANGMMRHVANVLLNRPDVTARSAAERFLAGYASCRPLGDEERRAIPAAMLERELQRILRRLWMHLYENDRMGSFMDKIPSVVLPNLFSVETRYGFLE